MELLLRKHLWLLDLLALVATAVVAAHATAHTAAGVLLRLSLEDPPVVVAPSPDSVVPTPDRRAEAIVRRNIFCSACGQSAHQNSPDQPAPSRPLPLRLIAIMYAPPPVGPRLSAAIIKDQRGASGAYVVGAAVECPPGLATVDAIDELGVALRLSDGQRQYLPLLEGGQPRAPAPTDPLVAELDAGITKLGENRYGVQRTTIESLLGKLDALPSQARLEPDVRDGKPIGFRLRDIKSDGVFARIGLHDGDVISSVNGLATTGPDNALAIYTSLRSVGHLSVALERAGRRITTEYDIE